MASHRMRECILCHVRAADECGSEWRPRLIHARVAGLASFSEAGNLISVLKIGSNPNR